MTEAEWLACDETWPMLDFLLGASSRKLRLFSVECCRRIWHLLDESRRNGVEVAGRYADGLATLEELQAIRTANEVDLFASPGQIAENFAWKAAYFVAVDDAFEAASIANRDARFAAIYEADPAPVSWWQEPPSSDKERRLISFPEGDLWLNEAGQVVAATEANVRCHLLRDIFGNPFRPVTIDPAWLTWNCGTVVHLAQAIYDERAFDRMPILADALEDAGCHDADILEHCRGGREHVRGCWLVDLILGKD